MTFAPPITRDLTWNERRTWGHCAHCGAAHGQPCRPIGPFLGLTAEGKPPEDGVHLCRLNAAPTTVRLEPVT